MKSALLSMAAHDLKNPLVSIKNMAQIIREDESVQGKSGELSELIQQGSQKMIGLINDLLNLSAIESGEIILRKKPIDVRDMTAALIEINRAQATKKHQTFDHEIATAGPFIVSADQTIWKYPLPKSYAFTFTPMTDAAESDGSITGTGQPFFEDALVYPAAPGAVGCSKLD